MIKAAMIGIDNAIKKHDAHLILTVHDEILVSCPKKNAQTVYGLIEKCMFDACKVLDVPVKIDIKYGRTWAEAHGDGIKLES